MSIVVDWGNEEETLVIWRFEKHWTWDDFYSALRRLQAMCADQSQWYIVLMDTRGSATPAGMVVHARRAIQQLPANIHKTVVVTDNGMLYSLHQLLQNERVPLTTKVHFVKSVDHGYDLVEPMLTAAGG